MNNHNNTVDFKYQPKLSWTCIGFPDDVHKSLVRQDGSLQYGFERVISFGLIHTLEKPVATQKTEKPESGIVQTLLDYGFCKLHLTTFATRDEAGRRADIVQWRLEPTLPCNKQTLIGAIVVTLDEVTLQRQRQRLATPSHDLPLPLEAEMPASDCNASLLLRSLPSELSVCEDYEHVGKAAFTTEPDAIHNGKSLQGAFIIALDAGVTIGDDAEWCAEQLQKARSYWDDYKPQKLRLHTPDKEINAMLAACARNIMQAREIKNGKPHFQVGPLVYRGLWMVDGFFINEVARFLGFDEAADAAWDLLLQYRKEDGSISIMPFHTKETGIAIATFVRMSELSNNWDRLKSDWSAVKNAVEFIRKQREEAYNLPESDLCHKLIPESFADGGIGGKRPEYTTILWTLVGLKYAAYAADKIGSADAEAFNDLYRGMLDDFTQHARRYRIPTDSGHLLFMSIKPDQHNYVTTHCEKDGKPQPWTKIGPAVATWALCHAIYPGEVFTPDADFVTDLLSLNASLDEEEGIPKETGWIPWNGLWCYHASFAAHAALYAGRPDKAVQYLYAMANHAFPTRVWREEQSLASHPQSRYIGDMPHNWASAEFTRLTRNLLVLETFNEIHLLRGFLSAWMIENESVHVERTPTRFGRITLDVRIEENATLRVQVELVPNGFTEPRAIILHYPECVRSIYINGLGAQLCNDRRIPIPLATVARR